MTSNEQLRPHASPAIDPAAEPDDGPGDLRCIELAQVGAFYDGELSKSRSQSFAEHLRQCAVCAEELRFLEKVTGAFESAERPRLSADSRRRLEESVGVVPPPGDEHAGAMTLRPARTRADVRWVRRFTGIAAAVFILAVARGLYVHHNPQAGPGSEVVNPTLDPRPGPSSRTPIAQHNPAGIAPPRAPASNPE